MKLKRYSYSQLSSIELNKLYERPKIDFTSIFSIVEPIIDEVKKNGDQALYSFSKQYDQVDLDSLRVSVPSVDEIALDETIKTAFQTAYHNIYAFHKAQYPSSLVLETMPGIECRREARAIKRVGLYVPGGTAVLPSSVLMLGVPAQIAGCKEIVLCTPPSKIGIHKEVLFAAALCGIKKVYTIGGAQAVAAMSFGTESVPKVDKILGPGNQYVTAAKMLLQNSEAMVAIDMPAGPSEVLVIADKTANPSFIAADLLSQAEHGSDSQVVLVAKNGFDLDKLDSELENQLHALPRKAFATEALRKSYIMSVTTDDEIIQFTNEYAPEHLIIQTINEEEIASHIECAGSIFLGKWTPESLGDYASGTNHTLPTYGYAKMYSGVNLLSYMNFITIQKASADGLKQLGPHVEIMAQTEDLEAHKNAVSIRLKVLKDEN